MGADGGSNDQAYTFMRKEAGWARMLIAVGEGL